MILAQPKRIPKPVARELVPNRYVERDIVEVVRIFPKFRTNAVQYQFVKFVLLLVSWREILRRIIELPDVILPISFLHENKFFVLFQWHPVARSSMKLQLRRVARSSRSLESPSR